MATRTRKPPKVGNQCVDNDVSLPLARPKAKQPTCAADLTDNQIYLLAEQWAIHGGHPADRVYSLYGFTPSEEDRASILWTISINGGWADHLSLARIGWANWCERRTGSYPSPSKGYYGNPE
jgi:hypothetical protein